MDTTMTAPCGRKEGGGADDAACGHTAVLVRILDDDCDNDDKEHDQGNWSIVVHREGRLYVLPTEQELIPEY